MDPLETVAEAMRHLTRSTCIVCKRSLPRERVFVGTCGDECSAYLDGLCAGVAAGEWRALLERDVLEVERAAAEWRLAASARAQRAAVLAEEARFCLGIDPPLSPDEEPYLDGAIAEQRRAAWHYAEARMYRDMAADCEAWLVRAKAVLG